jgi:HPt (histidine-containing phosphotransfer) domain-containing protein
MDILKWDKNFALDQTADDEELLKELLEIFKDSFQSDLQIIKQGLAEGSASMISAAAHSIKGAAASLGFLGINEIAMQVEKDSRDGGLAVAHEKIEDLQNLLLKIQAL